MTEPSLNHIVMAGTGRVAWNLCKAFVEKGLPIHEVVGRDLSQTMALAEFAKARAVIGMDKMTRDADFYILAVSDDAIATVAKQMPPTGGLVVHTSGMTSDKVLKEYFGRSGVFYPLQTFSIGYCPDFERIPILVQADSENDLTCLSQLAAKLSSCVMQSDDHQRQTLHLAAVFVNNFGNALFDMAAQILEKEQLPLSLLEPLIRETALKISRQTPSQAQSGPARRNDYGTIHQHLNILKEYPQLEPVYQMFTEYIRKKYLS